jgi:hypothetical protein
MGDAAAVIVPLLEENPDSLLESGDWLYSLYLAFAEAAGHDPDPDLVRRFELLVASGSAPPRAESEKGIEG